MIKPHIIKICNDYYECHFHIPEKYCVRIGSGSTPHEAWLYALWGAA